MTGALLGLAIGLVAHWALKGRLATLVMLIIATGLGFAVAKYGQTQFAASYAEDAFAGRLWFFGWHATTVMSFATITAASLFRPK